MPVELIVPPVGESITEVQIGAWRKQPGDPVRQDESVVELESDKATVDLPAPIAGAITKILKKEGERANIGEVIGYMEKTSKNTDASSGAKPAPEAHKVRAPKPVEPLAVPPKSTPIAAPRVMPAARRIMAEQGLTPESISPTGPGGRVLKEDALRAAQSAPAPAQLSRPPTPRGTRDEERVPMTPMRRRIAERLVEAQRTGALLTTFNEIDMSAVIGMREEYKAEFMGKHGVKLGFMSFFVKAAVEALIQNPRVNAEIRHGDIVYHHYYDIGVAVGGGKGLVVPVLRNAESLSFAEIEKHIADFGARAKENKIAIDELEGGTFTISNGGVYGSMMSTPIVNPPQSGILGLHAIQERPVARDGQVVIRPMMYVALTYDHRLVDGREAVTFLKQVKEYVEKPARMLLDL